MTTPAVECRGISVRFMTERRTVTALEDVSFSVQAGGFISLLGPSGCGKSTLLRVVADLIAPSEGDKIVRILARAFVPFGAHALMNFHAVILRDGIAWPCAMAQPICWLNACSRLDSVGPVPRARELLLQPAATMGGMG